MPNTTRRARFAGSIVLGMLCALSAALTDPGSAAASTRSATEEPITWVEESSRTILSRPGVRWTLHLEAARTGTAESDGREVPIRQTRVRLTSDPATSANAKGTPEIAVIQHLDNLEIAILSLDDPRLSTPPITRQGDQPWPNPCGFHFVDLPTGFDIDQDDRNDFALRAHSTIDDPRANQLLFFDEGTEGKPTLIDAATFVGTIKADGVVLVDIQSAKPYPILQARFAALEGCRFLAQLGIRGTTECEDCCAMPMFLHRLADGKYHPTYDRTVQQPLLERLREDLELVGSGDPLDDLSSAEQAALARAASFFYLTGQGARTRSQLELALGGRSLDYAAQLLLDRIADYFLAPGVETEGVPDAAPDSNGTRPDPEPAHQGAKGDSGSNTASPDGNGERAAEGR